MSWTPIVGKSDYAFGKTITPYSNNNNVTKGSQAKDPFKNILGTQDYTTLYTGGNGKTITPGTGLKNVASPTPGSPQMG